MVRIYTRFTGICLLLSVLVIFLACDKKSTTESETPTNNWLPITENVNGELTEIEGIPLLTLWGTNYEQGYAHGYLFAPEIIEYLEIELSVEGTVEFYENIMLPNIDKYTVPQEYLREMEGFLAGMEARAGGPVYVAGVDRTLTLNDVIASSCVDNVQLILDTHCTSFSAWGALTAGGVPITGRNYDQPDDFIHTGRYMFIVRKFAPGSGVSSWISIDLPGGIRCDTGMNAEGVTLATQEVNNVRECSASDGFCPENVIYRKLLESARAASVVEDVSSVLQNLYTNGGEALLMSWPSGQGACSAVFEIDGDLTTWHGLTVRQPESGCPYMIQTNQFYERLAPESSRRYSLIEDYLDGIIAGDNPLLTVDKTWDLMGQVPASQDLLINTGVVFEPDSMLMHVAFAEPGTHATSCRRITVDVDELLN